MYALKIAIAEEWFDSAIERKALVFLTVALGIFLLFLVRTWILRIKERKEAEKRDAQSKVYTTPSGKSFTKQELFNLSRKELEALSKADIDYLLNLSGHCIQDCKGTTEANQWDTLFILLSQVKFKY